MRAIFYIDGFNLYNGLFKNGTNPVQSRYKWLDLSAMCNLIGAPDETVTVKYFTARVSNTQRDPFQRNRQEVYWRALRSLSDPPIQLIEGKFMRVEKSGIVKRVLHGRADADALVRIETFEEKGSGVNIAVELVADGLLDGFDRAYVISNDSDLCGAIEKVITVAQREVHVINPTTRKCYQLDRVATRYRGLSHDVVRSCELPDTIVIPGGRITRPMNWT